MLNNIKIAFSRVKYILDTDTFKMIFLSVLFMSFFSIFNIAEQASYTEGLFCYFSSKIFLFPLICIIFISSCFFLFSFDKDYSSLLRFDNKASYLKKLVISLSVGNAIVYLSAIIMGFLFVTLKYFGAITFSNVEYYNIPYIVYIPFTLVKYFIIINFLSIIGICIYKIFGKVGGYAYYAIVLVLYYCLVISADIINLFTIKNLNFVYYLAPVQYASFSLEVSHSIIFICILTLILFLLMYVLIKFSKIKIDE